MHSLIRLYFFIFIFISADLTGQVHLSILPQPGYKERIWQYVDSLRVFDSHEHLFDPKLFINSNNLDFSLLFLENSFNDLVSSGMEEASYNSLFGSSLSPSEKWKIIEPHWNNSFNTTSNRVILTAIKDLYNIGELNASTVETLTDKMRKSYTKEWLDHVLRDICKIDYIIQDAEPIKTNGNYIRNAARFCTWLSIDSKKVVDSLAIMQIEPIYALEGLVKSMTNAFYVSLNEGMAVIKIDMAYYRTLSFENVTQETAKKVFKTLVNGNEDHRMDFQDVKPLQDYMVHQLLKLAQKHKIPVAFHTGLQAGHFMKINNADPTQLANLFFEYPDVNFVLFHGSYPFGGELSTLAKNFSNVFIDMNWTYSISPAYAFRYLNEWLETVPANKIMAFGGDQRFVENTYGNLLIAKKIISDVLISKVSENYLSESEAKNIARMLLYDNGMKFYNIR